MIGRIIGQMRLLHLVNRRFFRFFRYLTPRVLWETGRRTGEQRLMGLASEIAYNAMFALFPSILAVFTAIGLFDPLTTRFERMVERVSEVVPLEVFRLVNNFAEELSNSSNGGLFSLSFFLAIWISSGAVGSAMRAMDQIHQVPRRRRRPFWKAKLISIGLTLGAIALLILASFLIFLSDILLGILIDQAAQRSSILEQALLTVAQYLSFPLALCTMSVAFAVLYRFGPSRWNPGKPILPGAMLAAISWAVISGLFRLYVIRFGNYNRVYGAVGAVIVLLLWLYLSSLVMLIGDQLNVVVGEAMQQAKSDRRELKGKKGKGSIEKGEEH
ncbi:MAG: YihY/virulence factor BrkB family protein [Synechococcales bacterium]|nr:YihY/virulence factor BrkB family protein [Synechococcales bacterium]